MYFIYGERYIIVTVHGKKVLSTFQFCMLKLLKKHRMVEAVDPLYTLCRLRPYGLKSFMFSFYIELTFHIPFILKIIPYIS